MLSNLLRNLPDGVKNLLFINVLMYIGITVFPQFERSLMLYFYESTYFKPHQILTHLFMHANFMHLLFNMFMLVMLGAQLERFLGLKRFLILYFAAGFGASILPMIFHYFEYSNIYEQVEFYKTTRSDEYFYSFLSDYFYPVSDYYSFEFKGEVADVVGKMKEGNPYSNSEVILERIYYSNLNTASLGASGCVMGVMAAFGYLWPNQEFRLLLPPISIPAKLYIPVIIFIELFLGIANFQLDNVGHWAHIGGAIVGLCMVLYWNKYNRDSFY